MDNRNEITVGTLQAVYICDKPSNNPISMVTIEKGWVNMMFRLVCKLVAGFYFLVLTAGSSFSDEHPRDLSKVPIQGMVTVVDLGAKKCIPCKMMAPILGKMEKVYHDKAAIVFIDVWENREQAKRFGVQAIPTQIFFDYQGKEVYRHVGFMSEKAMVAQLKKMGIDP